MSIPSDLPDAFKTQLGEARSKWGWFVALGVLFLFFGIYAFYNLFAATVASVFVVGTVMLIAGVAEIVHAFYMRTWKHFLWLLLGGVLYAIAGFFAFYNPLFTSAILTFMLAIALVASGAMHMAFALGQKATKNWGWMLAAGILTVLAGLVIALGWPVNSLWILGLFLAIDLTFRGWALIAFGFSLKKG
jgi:uncharacterized membrane protein HdeD (DUF308 family)